ncbi:MAG: hypothetical protein DMD41_12935 [Gemmatimonadetes bacterium]|nr:MAG: hypothetical protein DMD41_12935 [Gemmatimonadota bacterium]
MLLLKPLQSLVKALHSEGTPRQVAAGIALGSILGLTPLVNLHNALVFGLIIILNVSFPGAMLGWALFVPVGFLLDPLFDRIGRILLLETPALTPLWTTLSNTPVVPLTNFNNSVVLGSLVCALLLLYPLLLASRRGVIRYRDTVGAWVERTQLLKASYLLGFAGLVVLGWWLFADRLARRGAEAVGTAILGARVEIDRLHLDLLAGKVEVRGLTAASPFEPLKNLFQADELVADVDVAPLLERKVIVDRLAAKGLRFGTPRATSGIVSSAEPSATQRVAESVKRWAGSIQFPALQLATGKIAVGRLDPGSLATPRDAKALAARADSSRVAWAAALQGLDLGPTIDSAVAMANRLRGAKPTDLALLNQARRTLGQVKQTRDRMTTLERGITTGVAGLQAGVAGLSDARQRDYAFARGLLKLPALDAPDVGAALLGPVALARFQRALYLAQLGRQYAPPGLLPRAGAGPRRMRRAGTTVRFPREHALPGFLLRDAELSFQLEPTAPRPKAYTGRLTGLTSDPALYGRPTVFTARAPTLQAGALLDHVRSTPYDTAGATLQGVKLPALALGTLPLRLEPGAGTVTLGFALRGDTLRGRWGVRSDALRWVRDSAVGEGGGAGSDAQGLVERVLSGIGALDLTAELRGTIDHPSLAVSSNLDRAVADRLRALVGEEAARAARTVRAQVDSIADRETAPVRAQVAAVTNDVTARLAEQRGRLDQSQHALEQRLRDLTRGIRLP